MDLDYAIGNLLIVGFRGGSLDCPETRADVEELKRAHVGGVILFDRDLATGGPRNIASSEQLKKLIDDLRNELGADLVVSIDQEGGEVSRLNPRDDFLASISAAELSEMSDEEHRSHATGHAEQLAGLGVNLNFTPCVDLAINKESTIIAKKKRSFGSDPERVSDCASMVINAHHERGIRCCIKHFPGHGSAAGDTHKGLVDITDSYEPQEIYPYTKLIASYGKSIAVMTGHLVHRGRDADNPASLSHAITTGWLRHELGFDGLVITDSLDMGGAIGGGNAARAINAGADIALNGNNTPSGFEPGLAKRMHIEIHDSVTPERVFESASRVDGWTR